jgi:hypothetical protein
MFAGALTRGSIGTIPASEETTNTQRFAGGFLGDPDSNLRMAESKSAALPLGDAPMPLFIPGCRLRRPDHNARRDKPQPRSAGSTKITTGGQRPATSSASGAPRKRPGGEQRVAAPHQGEINATSDISDVLKYRWLACWADQRRSSPRRSTRMGCLTDWPLMQALTRADDGSGSV